MKNKQDISRRNFIRNSMMAGGAVLFSSVLPANDVIKPFFPIKNGESGNRTVTDELLIDVCDIHLHAAPDSKDRLGNELEFARAARDAGYKSMLFKSNDFSCHDRAYLIRQELPDFEVFGSLCMNRVHGDKVNVFAAEKAVNTTGNLCRCIWMPTQDAASGRRNAPLHSRPARKRTDPAAGGLYGTYQSGPACRFVVMKLTLRTKF